MRKYVPSGLAPALLQILDASGGETEFILRHLKSEHSTIWSFRTKRTPIILVHPELTTPHSWMFVMYYLCFFFFVTLIKRKEDKNFLLEVYIQLLDKEKHCHPFRYAVSAKSTHKYFFQEAPVAGIQSTAQQIKADGIGVTMGEDDIVHYSSDGYLEIVIKIKENKSTKTEQEGWDDRWDDTPTGLPARNRTSSTIATQEQNQARLTVNPVAELSVFTRASEYVKRRIETQDAKIPILLPVGMYCPRPMQLCLQGYHRWHNILPISEVLEPPPFPANQLASGVEDSVSPSMGKINGIHISHPFQNVNL